MESPASETGIAAGRPNHASVSQEEEVERVNNASTARDHQVGHSRKKPVRQRNSYATRMPRRPVDGLELIYHMRREMPVPRRETHEKFRRIGEPPPAFAWGPARLYGARSIGLRPPPDEEKQR
jgi:hypothetical protein